MEIKLLSKNEEHQWTEYVNKHSDSDIYHTLIWKNVINKTYGYEPRYYIALKNDKIVGVIPLFLIKKIFGSKKLSSGPFTCYTYMTADNNQVTEALISNSIEEAKNLKAKYLELKLVKKLDKNIIDKFKLIEVVPYKLTTLKLTDYETLQTNFLLGLNKNLKRYRRKMEAENLKFHFCNGERELKELWNLILKEYLNKFGVPCGPYKTFKINYHKLKDSYKVFTIKDKDGTIVAGYIFIIFNDKAIYLYSVTHKDYTRLNLSTLLTGEAIRWCCDNNLKIFSFGPSLPSQESLISFKEKWGGVTEDVYYYYYSISGNISYAIDFGPSQSLLRKICRFLPLSLIKLILPVVAKQLG